MNVLDLGAGYDPQRWLPGADVADNNLCDEDIPEMCDQNVHRGFFGDDKLPVPDGYYGLIWYSYGWNTVAINSRKRVAAEITRVAGSKATLVLRDYCSYYNYKKDKGVCLTAKQWKRIVETCFPEWNLDGFYIELASSCDVPETYDEELCVVAILTKGWG